MFSVQRQDYVDVATGSLGQGLSVAAGMAYCGKYYDKARSAARYIAPSFVLVVWVLWWHIPVVVCVAIPR